MAEFEAANPDIKVKQIVFDDDQYSDTGLITQMKSQRGARHLFPVGRLPVERDVGRATPMT